jgi:hypothetical protein
MIIVQVGSADSSGTEPHQYLATCGRGSGRFSILSSLAPWMTQVIIGVWGSAFWKGVSVSESRSMAQVLDILLRHLVSDVVRLANG